PSFGDPRAANAEEPVFGRCFVADRPRESSVQSSQDVRRTHGEPETRTAEARRRDRSRYGRRDLCPAPSAISRPPNGRLWLCGNARSGSKCPAMLWITKDKRLVEFAPRGAHRSLPGLPASWRLKEGGGGRPPPMQRTAERRPKNGDRIAFPVSGDPPPVAAVACHS